MAWPANEPMDEGGGIHAGGGGRTEEGKGEGLVGTDRSGLAGDDTA